MYVHPRRRSLSSCTDDGGEFFFFACFIRIVRIACDSSHLFRFLQKCLLSEKKIDKYREKKRKPEEENKMGWSQVVRFLNKGVQRRPFRRLRGQPHHQWNTLKYAISFFHSFFLSHFPPQAARFPPCLFPPSLLFFSSLGSIAHLSRLSRTLYVRFSPAEVLLIIIFLSQSAHTYVQTLFASSVQMER